MEVEGEGQGRREGKGRIVTSLNVQVRFHERLMFIVHPGGGCIMSLRCVSCLGEPFGAAQHLFTSIARMVPNCRKQESVKLAKGVGEFFSARFLSTAVRVLASSRTIYFRNALDQILPMMPCCCSV